MEVLKRDSRKRVRVPRERQEVLLDEFERSGLSGARFALLSGVNYQSFAGWVRRRRLERTGKEGADGRVLAEAKVHWLEAVVGEKPAGALRVVLADGSRLEITDRSQVALAAELLRILGRKEGLC